MRASLQRLKRNRPGMGANRNVMASRLAGACGADSMALMLNKLFAAFRADHPEDDLPASDTGMAIGALLVRVARADGEGSPAEMALVERILAQRFRLGPAEAARLRETCEKLHAVAPETDTFARLIRETTELDTRLATLDALWEVLLAGDNIREEELHMVEKARKAMGLSRLDSARARERAENRAGNRAGSATEAGAENGTGQAGHQ